MKTEERMILDVRDNCLWLKNLLGEFFLADGPAMFLHDSQMPDPEQITLSGRIRPCHKDDQMVDITGELRFFRDYVEFIIRKNIAWHWTPQTSQREFFLNYLSHPYRGNSIFEDKFDDTLNACMTDFHFKLVHFLGPNPWIVHTTLYSSAIIIIEKGVDYRITDWERRTESGEWK